MQVSLFHLPCNSTHTILKFMKGYRSVIEDFNLIVAHLYFLTQREGKCQVVLVLGVVQFGYLLTIVFSQVFLTAH
jgi:hypothetical protein